MKFIRLTQTNVRKQVIQVNPIVHGVSRVALKHGGGVNLPPLVKISTTKAFDFKFGTHTH